MATYSSEYIFEISKQKYEKIQEIITEVCEIVKTVQPDLDEETVRGCFDLVIQSCMLNAAATDGKLEKNEVNFITGVTSYADILLLVNAQIKRTSPAFEGFSWEQVAGFNSEQLRKVSVAAAAIVDQYANTFVEIFATVDKIMMDRDYRAELNGAVGSLFVGLAGVDGDDLDSERAVKEGCVAFSVYDKMIDKKWKRIVEE